jgi:hypothetical protein
MMKPPRIRIPNLPVLPFLLLLLGGVLTPSSRDLLAQSVLDRTPNLQGDWVGHELNMTFVHRMWRMRRGGETRVVASTITQVAYPVRDDLLIAAQYASRARVGRLNEWELLGRWVPLAPGDRVPLGLALTAAYNTAAESFDGELTFRLPASRLTLLGSIRGFSDAYRSGDSRLAAGAGVIFRASQSVALAGDLISVLDRESGERMAWSAGLQLWIPRSPHSISFHATNAMTTTLQGSAFGSRTMWGFDFTTPLTFF